MLNSNICIRHFEPSDFNQRAGKFVLKSNSIPTVFNGTSSAVDVADNFNDLECIPAQSTTCSNAECANCKYLLHKVSELEQSETKNSINHSISVQKLKQKLISSNDAYEKLKDRMSQIQKELCQEKTQNLKMKDVIVELQRERKIFNDDATDVIA